MWKFNKKNSKCGNLTKNCKKFNKKNSKCGEFNKKNSNLTKKTHFVEI